MNSLNYIEPNLTYYESFTEFQKSNNRYDGKGWKFKDLLNHQIKSSYITGEPGYGKSRLLQEITLKTENSIYVDLKKLRGKTIPDYLSDKNGCPKEEAFKSIQNPGYFFRVGFSLNQTDKFLLCLDALDEISNEYFALFRDHLSEFIDTYKNCTLLISGRTHNIKNLIDVLPKEWPVVNVEEFEIFDVRSILEEEIPRKSKEFIARFIQSTLLLDYSIREWPESLLQVPRYLIMAVDLLNTNEPQASESISKVQLFDLFIRRKLKKEQDKLHNIDSTFIHKTLCMLALVMEIKQTNQITKDEFATILDDVQSDIKQFVFNKISPDEFYKFTLLKDTGNQIEFENKEFQEFLAAKEILSWPDTEQLIYDLCYIPELRSISVSWYNTLSYVFHANPNLIPRITQKHISDKTATYDFFYFILNTLQISGVIVIDKSTRQELFDLIVNYHNSRQMVISYRYENKLSLLYAENEEGFYTTLNNAFENGNTIALENMVKLFIPIAKEGLIKHKDAKWKDTMHKICKKYKHDKDIIELALPALAIFKDKKLIEKFDHYLDEISDNKQPFIDAFFYAILDIGDRHQLLKYSLHFFHHSNRSFPSIKKIIALIFNDKKLIVPFIEEISQNKKDFSNLLSLMNYESFKIEKKFEIEEDEIGRLIQGVDRIINYLLVDDNGLIYETTRSKVTKEIFIYLVEISPNYTVELLERLKDKENYILEYKLKFVLLYLLNKSNIDACLRIIEQSYSEDFLMSIIHVIEIERPDLEVEEKLNTHLPKIQQKHKADPSQNHLEIFKGKLRVDKDHFKLDVFSYYRNNYSEIAKHISAKDYAELKRLLNHILQNVNLKEVIIKFNKLESSRRKQTITSNYYFQCMQDIVNIPNLNKIIDIKQHRETFLAYATLNIHTEVVYDLLKPLLKDEIEYIFDLFTNSKDDRALINVKSFISFVKKYHVATALPKLKEVLLQLNALHEYEMVEILKTIAIFEKDINFYIELLTQVDKTEHKDLWFGINEVLIRKFQYEQAVNERITEIKNRKFRYIKPEPSYSPYGLAYSQTSAESELSHFSFAFPLMEFSDLSFRENYFDLLKFSMSIFKEDPKEYEAYSDYIDTIVFSYFNNLKVHKSYDLLEKLLKDIDTATHETQTNKKYNWRIDKLKKDFSIYIESSKPLTEYIKKYNRQKEKRYLDIPSIESLKEIIFQALNKDLRSWIEVEGAYKMIQSYQQVNREITKTEDLMQKTLVSQFENILLKKEIRDVDIYREVEQLDSERTDFLIKYGFIGPVMVEIKRSGNSDFSNNKIQIEKYKRKLIGYMQKAKTKYGFYLIFNDTNDQKFTDKIDKHKTLYEDTSIKVIGIDCMNLE